MSAAATAAGSIHQNAPILCPNPALHQLARDDGMNLQQHASKAALLVTQSSRSASAPDANAALSSSCAAPSRRYARPENLPSFPVVGIDRTSSAGTAATLAHSNRKSFEQWKPDSSFAASKAALLANDYQSTPTWAPEASTAGSKAALLAHRDKPKSVASMPSPSSEGNSAASIAMKNRRAASHIDQRTIEDGRKWALQAATGSVKRRRRSDGNPLPKDAAAEGQILRPSALNAATFAHHPRDTMRPRSQAIESPRLQHGGPVTSRQMNTEHSVQIESEEERRTAALKASAISFAKQMYQNQEKHLHATKSADDHATAASRAHKRASSATTTQDLKQQAMQYINLQETARKLAAERLAKLNLDEETEFRSYYGYEKSPRARLSIRTRNRRRASSEGATLDSDDEEQARPIRNQTLRLNSGLAKIDAKKRTADRLALMAAAEKRVQARMHEMDEKVFQETGKVSPAMLQEWDAKARAKAVADKEERVKNYGKVHLGQGKYLNQRDVDEIARQRIQPTLDQITDAAERQRALDEGKKMDEDMKKREALKQKEQQNEEKAEAKRLREEEKAIEKAQKTGEKAAIKTEKARKKARRKEEKATAKEEKRAERQWASERGDHERPSTAGSIRTARETQPIIMAQDKPKSPKNENEARPEPQHRLSFMPTLEPHISAIPSASSSSVSSLVMESTADPSPSDNLRSEIDSQSASSPQATEGTTKLVSHSSPHQMNDTHESPTKRRSGFSGFIDKLKSKKKPTPGALKPFGFRDHQNSDDGKESENSAAVRAVRTESTSSPATEHLQPQAPGSGAHASASSIGRKSSEISSFSEAEVIRGRGVLKQRNNSRELFEEAKDTFDEARLPAPKFLREERKSPMRQTVFHEEL